MDAQGCERLSRALAEAYIAQTLFLRGREYVLDGVWNVMPREFIDAVVPEFGGVWIMMYRLLGVFVTAIIAEPDIEALFD